MYHNVIHYYTTSYIIYLLFVGTDFQNITDQQITIPAGVNHFVYSFDIQEDEVFEGTEHFTVFIRKIENSQIVIGDISTATVVIKDNDSKLNVLSIVFDIHLIRTYLLHANVAYTLSFTVSCPH